MPLCVPVSVCMRMCECVSVYRHGLLNKSIRLLAAATAFHSHKHPHSSDKMKYFVLAFKVLNSIISEIICINIPTYFTKTIATDLSVPWFS